MRAKNVLEISSGSYRSLSGAATEHAFIGRAVRAGFHCFFKVWRDMPYDLVVDVRGLLYRVEVKGGTSAVEVTRGGRTGRQIIRDNRRRLITREDCDLVAWTNNESGECHLIPVEFCALMGRFQLRRRDVEHLWKEAWWVFEPESYGLPRDLITRDVSTRSAHERAELDGWGSPPHFLKGCVAPKVGLRGAGAHALRILAGLGLAGRYLHDE
jgi:PD-(D/E)XK endonuclease